MADWRNLHADAFSGARVLITGGAGFIGSHLTRALVGLGASVVVLDDLSGGSRDNLESAGASPGAVDLVVGTIRDPDVVSRCVEGCAYMFHLAALGSVPRSVEFPLLYQQVNAEGTINVLEAARRAGVRRVVFAASSSAYGDNPVPWVENMPSRPRSPYAATKVAGEALLRAYAASYGMGTASLRYFNIFGPRQNANSAYAAVIAAFAKALLGGARPVIYGDGEQSRDFTFVDNAVHANLLAARHRGTIGGEVLNVGCGGRVSVNELARRIADAAGRTDLRPEYRPERAGDIKHSFADLARSEQVLGYRPIVDFESGLRQTIDWYRSVL